MPRYKEGGNLLIQREIFVENNQTVWMLRGKHSSQKAVEEEVKALHIQEGNLCQFLPQVSPLVSLQGLGWFRGRSVRSAGACEVFSALVVASPTVCFCLCPWMSRRRSGSLLR